MKSILLLLLLTATAYSYGQTAEEQKVMTLVKEGKTTEAISMLQQILQTTPASVNALNMLSQLYLQEGKMQQAYDISSRGLQISRNDDNLSITKAKAAVKLGKTDEAILLMDACIARDAGFFMPYAVKGNALDAQNKIQLAIGMYTKSISLAPTYAINYYDRGVDFASISRYPQAIQDYTKAIELFPQSGDAYNMRGIAYYRSDKLPEAISDYSKAIENGNDNALVNRGVAYYDQGNNGLAKADYKKAIGISTTRFSDAYYQLAAINLEENEFDEALNNAQKAIALESHLPHYHALYAKTLLTVKKDQEALAAAEKVFLIDPKNPDGFILKSIALSNLKRFDEAVKVISEGITEYPDNYLMYAQRAFFYKFQGKTGLAAADDEKAKQLSTKK